MPNNDIDVTKLVPQAVPVDYWHAYGLTAEQAEAAEQPAIEVVGPHRYPEEHAITLGNCFTPERRYLATWTHQPTAEELEQAAAT